MYIRL